MPLLQAHGSHLRDTAQCAVSMRKEMDSPGQRGIQASMHQGQGSGLGVAVASWFTGAGADIHQLCVLEAAGVLYRDTQSALSCCSL